MKIGMIVNNLEVSGGYQKLVIRLAQQLQSDGHEVIVYSPIVDIKNCYPDSISKITIQTLKNSKNRPLNENFKELSTLISTDHDALIIHDEISLMCVANLPKNFTKKIIWMLNNQYPDNLGNYKSELIPIIKTKYSSSKDKKTDIKNAFLRVNSMRKGLKRISDFAVYDSLNASLVKKFTGKKAIFVAAGADLAEFSPLSKNRTFSEKKHYQILSVGVLFPHRRYEDLIQATSILVNDNYSVKTIIVGRHDLSPEYSSKLKELVSSLKMKGSIEFFNYVSDKEMIKLYKNSDAFVFINDGFTWGISVFEAVAAGLPTVITNNIGASDLIKNKKTGWVVEPHNPKQVAVSIKDIIDDRKHTRKITQNAQDLAEFVSWKAYTDRMLEIITR